MSLQIGLWAFQLAFAHSGLQLNFRGFRSQPDGQSDKERRTKWQCDKQNISCPPVLRKTGYHSWPYVTNVVVQQLS